MSWEYIKNIVSNFCLFKTHNTNKTCDKAISGNVGTLNLFLTGAKVKKCVIMRLIITLVY